MSELERIRNFRNSRKKHHSTEDITAEGTDDCKFSLTLGSLISSKIHNHLRGASSKFATRGSIADNPEFQRHISMNKVNSLLNSRTRTLPHPVMAPPTQPSQPPVSVPVPQFDPAQVKLARQHKDRNPYLVALEIANDTPDSIFDTLREISNENVPLEEQIPSFNSANLPFNLNSVLNPVKKHSDTQTTGQINSLGATHDYGLSFHSVVSEPDLTLKTPPQGEPKKLFDTFASVQEISNLGNSLDQLSINRNLRTPVDFPKTAFDQKATQSNPIDQKSINKNPFENASIHSPNVKPIDFDPFEKNNPPQDKTTPNSQNPNCYFTTDNNSSTFNGDNSHLDNNNNNNNRYLDSTNKNSYLDNNNHFEGENKTNPNFGYTTNTYFDNTADPVGGGSYFTSSPEGVKKGQGLMANVRQEVERRREGKKNNSFKKNIYLSNEIIFIPKSNSFTNFQADFHGDSDANSDGPNRSKKNYLEKTSIYRASAKGNTYTQQELSEKSAYLEPETQLAPSTPISDANMTNTYFTQEEQKTALFEAKTPEPMRLSQLSDSEQRRSSSEIVRRKSLIGRQTTSSESVSGEDRNNRHLEGSGTLRSTTRSFAHPVGDDEDVSKVLSGESLLKSSPYINWNEFFQKFMTYGILTGEDWETLEQLHSLAQQFIDTATTYAKLIISELAWPARYKTIKPIDIGGVAGGKKFLHANILFKLGLDTVIHKPSEFYMYGGSHGANDNGAMKSLDNELTGAIFHMTGMLATKGNVSYPLMAIIEYKGFKVLAECLLPISGNSIIYGSSNSGQNVHADDPDFNKQMDKIADLLRLKSHCAGSNSQQISGPGDIEGHFSQQDNRHYLLDFGRVLPPEDPRIRKDEHGRGIYINLLRPEFMITYGKPLISDAFSGWNSDPDPMKRRIHNHEVSQASYQLYQVRCKQFADDIDQDSEIQGIPWVSENLNREKLEDELDLIGKIEIHKRGLNRRHLGYTRTFAKSESARRLLLTICCGATIKDSILEEFRTQMVHSQVPSDEPFLEILTTLFWEIMHQSPEFWTNVATLLENKFIECLSAAEKENEHLLFQWISIPHLLVYLWDVLSIQLHSQAEKKILLSVKKFEFHSGDILAIGSRTKHLHIIYLAKAVNLMNSASLALTHEDVYRLLAYAKKNFEQALQLASWCPITLTTYSRFLLLFADFAENRDACHQKAEKVQQRVKHYWPNFEFDKTKCTEAPCTDVNFLLLGPNFEFQKLLFHTKTKIAILQKIAQKLKPLIPGIKLAQSELEHNRSLEGILEKTFFHGNVLVDEVEKFYSLAQNSKEIDLPPCKKRQEAFLIGQCLMKAQLIQPIMANIRFTDDRELYYWNF